MDDGPGRRPRPTGQDSVGCDLDRALMTVGP